MNASEFEPTTALPSPSWTHEPGPEGDATIEENWLFRLRKERFRSRLSDQAHSYYVMHLADAVYALALTVDDEMIFVRQFRAGSRRDSLEPPGGLVDAGEDPRAAAARELLEETGYAGDPPELIGSAFSNPSIMTSRIHVTIVRNARRVATPKLDHAEEVAVEFVPVRDVRRMIDDGKFDHALSVMSLLWWLDGERRRVLLVKQPQRFTTANWMAFTAVVAIVLGALLNLQNPVVSASLAMGALGAVVGLALGELKRV